MPPPSRAESADRVNVVGIAFALIALISILWTASAHFHLHSPQAQTAVCDEQTCLAICEQHDLESPFKPGHYQSSAPSESCPRCPKCETCPSCPRCPKAPTCPKCPSKQGEKKAVQPDLNQQLLEAGRQLREVQALTPPALKDAIEAYTAKHRTVIQDGVAADDGRFIIYAAGPNDGYGNRLPGVVTAFVWALLTGRVLLIEWRDDKVLMPHPAPFGTLFSAFGDLEFDVDRVKLTGQSSATKCNGREIWEEMSTVDLNDKFSKRIIRFNSDDWLFPLLASNPHYKEQIATLFPHGRAFHHVGAYLLALAPALQEKVDAFQTELFRDKFIVGMHLRLQKVMPDEQGRKKLAPPPPTVFFEAARMLQVSKGMRDEDTVFYVATETADAVAAARSWFSERSLRVVFLDDMYNIKRKNHRDAERGSVEALHNAIIELKLLSLADEMVGTFASSYSYVSSSWGNIIPYYIMPDGGYWHAGMSEPCFRFASRGHSVHMQGSPDLAYHTACAVTRNAGGMAVAERGKDGKLKEAKSQNKPKTLL